MRVACFGGTFDPPHPAHLRVAQTAQRLLGLDVVLFTPAGRQPLKQHEPPPASYEHRVAMLRLALAGRAGLEICLADAPRADGANYTVDMLERLKPALPGGAELLFLGGADSFLTLPHWRSPERLLRAGELLDGWVLAARPGFSFAGLDDALPPGFSLRRRPQAALPMEAAEVLPPGGHPPLPLWLLTGLDEPSAATKVRGQIEGGEEPKLDPEVLAYIRHHSLYRGHGPLTGSVLR